jgi:hypothetical protein
MVLLVSYQETLSKSTTEAVWARSLEAPPRPPAASSPESAADGWSDFYVSQQSVCPSRLLQKTGCLIWFGPIDDS